MTDLQEEFLNELKSKEKLTASKYALIYKKYNLLAIEEEKSKGARDYQAKSMGDYYTLNILSDFIGKEDTVTRIIDMAKLLKD